MLFENMVEVIDEEPHGAALNMAIDEVLLHHAQTPLLRIYHWARPALSFGYFGRAAEIVPDASGRETVRRWTGGGIVWHGADLTYSIIVPRDVAFFRVRPLESYAAIHRCMAALIPGATVHDASAAQSRDGFCFVAPSPNDLMRGHRKIAGGGQRRTATGLLHQGSVQPPAEDDASARIGSLLGNAFARRVCRRALTTAELEAGAHLAAEKYGTAAWLHRR
jgi:lipoate-protein ligase A